MSGKKSKSYEVKVDLAVTLANSRMWMTKAKEQLLKIMEDNESFDFILNGKSYRCWKKPAHIASRPKLDRTNGTFVMRDVVISESIVVRSIKPRPKS